MIIDPKLKTDLKKYLLERINANKAPKVVIKAPYMLDKADMDILKKNIHMLKKATIHKEVDQSILAGCIIQFGSQIIDLTLNSELQTLEHILYETA